MEKKNNCCSGTSYVSTPCAAMPKKEPVVTPKKEDDVKIEIVKEGGVEDAKGSLASETTVKKEVVKVNVGCGGGGGGGPP
ncbi:hypothetical protein F0562_015733 [Nyssa sinensis]|uniref:Uncharacterized protein n=1 Tax=Nyssa sinensis TaxID=561372 RepID=A0A5J4ZKR1_9ASTE|nr:hypothetical protein F0562_015733 [Nyssa sinensis]